MKALALCLAMFATAPAAVSAATITATSTLPSEFGSFTIEFTDTNGNGLLELGEVDSFSGFTALTRTISGINTVPDIPGISAYSFVGNFVPPTDRWRFLGFNSGGQFIGIQTIQTDLFNYELDLGGPAGGGGTVAPVPVPASLPLLLGALALSGLMLRRKTA